MSGLDDSYTKALLHMDGANNSTTFTDESGKTWTARNGAKTSTASPEFGSASCLLGGTNDYVDTPAHADWDCTGNFTIDVWIKKAGDGVEQCIVGQSDSSFTPSLVSFFWEINASNLLRFGLYNSVGTSKALASAATITGTNWHHIAVVRNGNTVSQYINGTADANTLDLTGYTPNIGAYKVAIGRIGETVYAYWNGNIDEFRFSKGIARWTGNFTPPTLPYGYMVGTPVACTPFMMI